MAIALMPPKAAVCTKRRRETLRSFRLGIWSDMRASMCAYSDCDGVLSPASHDVGKPPHDSDLPVYGDLTDAGRYPKSEHALPGDMGESPDGRESGNQT